MKTVLLLVACLAFASAAREGFPSGLEVQSNAFCTYSLIQKCSSLNATCTAVLGTNTYTSYYCPSGSYAKTVSGDCTCTGYTFTAPTLGATCNVGETAANAYQCRAKAAYLANGDVQTYWHSDKIEGDTCTSAFDCSGTLQCVSGKCYNRLLTGAICANSTTSLSAYCSVKDYCRANDDGNSYCTARLASGGDCSATADRAGCPSYQACLGQDHVSTVGTSGMTCQTPMYYVLAGGVWANYSTQCLTASWTNATDKTCLSYADQMAIYNYKKISDCSTDSDCSEYGSCDCVGTSSTATTCSFAALTNAELVAAWSTNIAKAKLFYDAGCSWYSYKPASTSYPYAGYTASTGAVAGTNSVAYCSVKLGYYQAAYTVCGAFHNMGMSSITIVLSAIIATLLAKW